MIIVVMGEGARSQAYDWQNDPDLTTRYERPANTQSPLRLLWLLLAMVAMVWLLVGLFNYRTKPHKYFVAYEYSYMYGLVGGTGNRVVSHTEGPVTERNVESFVRDAECYIAWNYYSQLASDPYGDFAICIISFQEIERSPLGWVFYR